MDLSNELISQFVKATKDSKTTKSESTVYGTTVVYDGRTYVKLDGSDLLTPVITTTDVNSDERVTVMIKDHTATITGNISSPAARTDDVKEVGNKITQVEIIVADKVNTKELEAESARIDTLVSDNVTIKERLTASEADIGNLTAEDVVINGKLTAQDAEIKRLDTEKLTVNAADIKFATIEKLEAFEGEFHSLESTYGEFQELTTKNFEAVDADIKNLETEKLDVEDAQVTYATIDFSNIGEAAIRKVFADSGLIKDLVVGDGTVTGNLVGVTISGDLIEGNTIKADKLVVKGEDGLYYKLNFEGGTFADGEVVPDEGLHGSVLVANTVTAEKINVDDLVAFDATIGGFNITSRSLYSGVKGTVDSTLQGVYLDCDGQLVLGGSDNFLKYIKVDDENYKLEISASSLVFVTSGRTIDEELNTRFSDEAERVDDELASLRDSVNELGETVNEKYTKTIVEDENGISITDSDGVYSIQVDNVEGVTIRKNGEIRSQLVDDNFYTGNIVVEVNERAQFGDFAFIPRKDGSLSFLKVGG